MGPKGEAVARSLELDGLISFGTAVPGMGGFDWSVLMVGGSVLADDEDLDSDHVRSAAGGA